MSEADQLSEPQIIYRKAKGGGHGGHHGGSWKVAYADFVTAMMAFFLLMWLLGATDEQKRRGIADYFAPTPMENTSSGGSNGLLAGRSLSEPEGNAPHAPGANVRAPMPLLSRSPEMRKIEKQIRDRIRKDAGLQMIGDQLRFTETPEGLRIDLIDEAKYSMFQSSTTTMDPRTGKLLDIVAEVVSDVPNRISIRGHTDSHKFTKAGPGGIGNNWALSTARAEATREHLAGAGIPAERFARLEGVADTQPFVAENGLDPRNRRISITLMRETDAG